MVLKLFICLNVLCLVLIFNESARPNSKFTAPSITQDSVNEALLLGKWQYNYSFGKDSGLKTFVLCHTCPFWDFNHSGIGTVSTFSKKINDFSWTISKPDTLFINGLEMNSMDTFLWKIKAIQKNKDTAYELKLNRINSAFGIVLSKTIK